MAGFIQNVRKNVRKGRVAVARPQLLRRVRSRERRNEREESPLTQEQIQTQQADSRKMLSGTRKILSMVHGHGLKGAAVIKASAATWAIIAGTAILYLVQFIMAALTLGGLAALVTMDTSWLGYADMFGWFSDFGQELLFVSLMIAFVIGFLTFLTAMFVFILRGVRINRGISILVAAVCLALYATPLLNFLPWMWLWCLYVVKSQNND